MCHQAAVSFGQLSPKVLSLVLLSQFLVLRGSQAAKARKGVLVLLRPSSSTGSLLQILRLLLFQGEVRNQLLYNFDIQKQTSD